ncbi:transporter [Actinomycetes bacterium]|nr:transporter [Actinomycetes bacterium]
MICHDDAVSLGGLTARGDNSPALFWWAWLSIAAAIATIALKYWAYLLTDSVGLLSDALESVVNLIAAVVALIALIIAARPADRTHHYGHGKVEYFSAGIEGLMIVVAAIVILYSAVERLLHPQPLEALGIGLLITLIATGVNAAAGWLILRAGRLHRSVTLVADGKHLMTDVWTSIGVFIGVGLVALTGWLPLDSIVAIAVGLNILWTGFGLARICVHGLMDRALNAADEASVIDVLNSFVSQYSQGELAFHALKTRASGQQRFISMHVLVPGRWTVEAGHDLVEKVESAIAIALPGSQIQTHLEPIEDPRSYDDAGDGHAGIDTSA